MQEPPRPGPCCLDVPAGLRAGARGERCAGCAGRDPWASQRPAGRLLAVGLPLPIRALGARTALFCACAPGWSERLRRLGSAASLAATVTRPSSASSADAPPPPARSHPRTKTPAGRPRHARLLGSAQGSFLKREQGAALRVSWDCLGRTACFGGSLGSDRDKFHWFPSELQPWHGSRIEVDP